MTDFGQSESDEFETERLRVLLESAIMNGMVPRRPIPSVRRSITNTSRIIQNNVVWDRLRAAQGNLGFQPVRPSLYVSELAEMSQVNKREVAEAIGIANGIDLSVLDEPVRESIDTQLRLRVADGWWDVMWKLAAMDRCNIPFPIMALRQFSPDSQVAQNTLLRLTEDQLRALRNNTDGAVADCLTACEMQIQAIRAAAGRW